MFSFVRRLSAWFGSRFEGKPRSGQMLLWLLRGVFGAVIISVAMFGLTAGAVWVYLGRDSFRPEHLSHHLARASLGFALTTAGSGKAFGR